MSDMYAVVTGSTKGIGKEIAESLLNNGYHVIVNYANDDEAYQEFLQENSKYKDKIDCIKLNLNSYENALSFCEKVKEITCEIKVLVLNSGITEKSEFGKIDKFAWENAMNVNLNCPFYIIQSLKDLLKKCYGGGVKNYFIKFSNGKIST